MYGSIDQVNKKMKYASLSTVCSVPSCPVILSIVIPETRLTISSALELFEADPLFLPYPFSTMAKADGTPAPLDLSDQEWPLLSYVAVPPTKGIFSPEEREPPDIRAPTR